MKYSVINNFKSNSTPAASSLSSPPPPPPPADDTDKDPALCSSSSAQVGNFFTALGSSLLDITGLGPIFGLKSPLEKLQDEMKKIKDKTQDIINQSTQIFAKQEGSIDEEILKGITFVNTSLQSYVGWQDEIINGKIQLNTIYIGGSFMLILMTIIFLLLSNAFKK